MDIKSALETATRNELLFQHGCYGSLAMNVADVLLNRWS